MVSSGPAYIPRPDLPPFKSHVKEKGGVEVEFGRSELAVTMGSSSVPHQLSSPVLDEHHHTLGVERPLSLGSHFYSAHLVHRARWVQRRLLPGQSRCYKTKPEKQIVRQTDT